MRIGIVCPYSMAAPGGVQEHVLGLAAHLRAGGDSVSVLAPTGEHCPEGLVSAGSAVPVRYNGSVARLSFGPVTRTRVRRWLDEGTGGGPFDLIHLHEPITPSCSALALWQAQTPVVATFHTAIRRSRALQAAWPAFRPALERVGGRIAVSAEARSTIERHTGKGAVVIPNGVRTGALARPADPRWVGTADRPTVAFLGRALEPRKGLAVLLAAMPTLLARRPGLRLLVAGADADQALVGLDPSVRAHVECLGVVSDDDRGALLSSVDAYVAPNIGGESFGIVLVEAMAAGAPVVASDLPAFVDVLAGAGSTFRTGDACDLARVLGDLLDAPQARAASRAAGLRRSSRFDWVVVGEQIHAVYETVLLAAGPRAVVGRV